MFDFDAGKLLIIAVVALIFIPSKDLPRVLRQLGQFAGKMRRMASEFQGQFMDAMREADLAELRREAEQLSKAAEAGVALDPVGGLDGRVTGTIASGAALSASDAESLAAGAAAVPEPVLAAEGQTAAILGEALKPTSVAVEDHGLDLASHAPEAVEPAAEPAPLARSA